MIKYLYNNNHELGRRIKERRKELKMTQKQLAAVAGCTFQQIQKYEYGYTRLSVPNFLKICSCLQTPPSHFFNKLLLREGSENNGNTDEDLEVKLLSIFRAVANEKIKARIVGLVEAIVSDAQNSSENN
ncbi:MAG: helix-turn-helix transcriptional regulator [Holosporales bacterium]|jgi:transcriptional regulator with XRE-family HTH domain|nr:helix-turn-helix transcriptional regulator [Holosporales bacterium]